MLTGKLGPASSGGGKECDRRRSTARSGRRSPTATPPQSRGIDSKPLFVIRKINIQNREKHKGESYLNECHSTVAAASTCRR